MSKKNNCMGGQKSVRGGQSKSTPWKKRFTTMALLAVLGTTAVVGCSSFDRQARNYGGTTLGDPGQDVSQTRRYVRELAKSEGLPERYISEARIRIADIESRLAQAQAIEVERDATRREKQALVDASRQEAQTRFQIAEAQAQKTQQEYGAKRIQLAADAEARKRSLATTAQQNEALIEALAKERKTVKDELISQANLEFASANARVEKQGNLRQTTEQESLAAIDDMKEAAKATRVRSDATVKSIRAQAEATKEQTQARASELRIEIQTVRDRSDAEADRLASMAKSIINAENGRAATRNARAKALTEQASQEQYHLKVKAADVMLEQANTHSQKALTQGQNNYDRSVAELELLRAEAQRITSDAQTLHTGGLAELEAWFNDSSAEVEKIRISSDSKETLAREEFVKAEAQAQADAIRQTAVHQQELAEDQMEQIIAEAQEEAARVRLTILDELAAQQAAGSVEFTGKTGPAPELPAGLHDVPEVPEVAPVTPILEPGHVAAFRSGLAEVMRDRSKADSQQMSLQATYDESRSTQDAVLNQQLAIAAEHTATTEALQTQADAGLAEAQAKATAALEIAHAGHQKLLADADSFRRETLAEVSDLRAQARADLEIARAKSNQLAHESEAVRKQGASEVKALDARLKGILKRGHAEHSRLMAEADSIEQSQAALAQQIDAQIVAAQRTLAAELMTLSRSIESQIIVAQANYNEALVNAEVLDQKADVQIARARAQYELENALTKAEIDRTMNLIYINEIKGMADVERQRAFAQADIEKSHAFSDAQEATIRAQAQIATASATANRQTADAQQLAVRSLFDARLVQVNSERVRDLTDEYRNDWYQRTTLEQALAEAEASREQTRTRLAELHDQQAQLQETAQKDWDARLADLRRYDVQPDTTVVQGQVPQPQADDFEVIQVTEVPTE